MSRSNGLVIRLENSSGLIDLDLPKYLARKRSVARIRLLKPVMDMMRRIVCLPICQLVQRLAGMLPLPVLCSVTAQRTNGEYIPAGLRRLRCPCSPQVLQDHASSLSRFSPLYWHTTEDVIDVPSFSSGHDRSASVVERHGDCSGAVSKIAKIGYRRRSEHHLSHEADKQSMP